MSVKQIRSRSGRRFVVTDLGPICLQRLLADHTQLIACLGSYALIAGLCPPTLNLECVFCKMPQVFHCLHKYTWRSKRQRSCLAGKGLTFGKKCNLHTDVMC